MQSRTACGGKKSETLLSGKRKRPGDLRGDVIADGGREDVATPYGAMPRRSVPLVRRLSEPRVRDSAAVHAEHRSVPWPFSFPVPRKNIAGRRNHNARPVLRHRDRRRTAFKCGRKLITSTWGLLALGRLPSRRQQFENRGLQRKAWIGTTVCTLPSCARRTSFSSAAVSPS